MGTLYENIIALCSERGIKGGKMCTDIGMSKGILTDLKMGRQTGISAANAQKIASYFGVSVGYLLGQETENTPTQKGERVEMDDFTYAMQNEAKELTDMDKQILLSMAKQLNDARKQKNGETQ